MKKIMLTSITLFFIFSITSSYAQKDTIWYDTNWNITTKSKASYFRCHCIEVDNGYWFTDYYVSGAKQMEGLSLEEDKEVYQGLVKWYHENGNVFQTVTYNKGILNGKRQVYYENGKLKTEENYKEGKKEGKWKGLYENGNAKEIGYYENGQKEGVWKIYYSNGKLKNEGKYVFDRKVDIWKTNYYDGTMENE